MNVIISDGRTDWMKKEDRIMTCMNRCAQYKHCSSRFGTDCKKLGGSEIPKIRQERRYGYATGRLRKGG
ncbi:hypothetical protein ACWE42_16100 [Sutcliffiella cohnii]